MTYMGYRVDSGIMKEAYMFQFALIFVAVIWATVIVVTGYVNTKAKK